MHRAVLALPFVVAALGLGAAAEAQSVGVISEGQRSLVWSNGDSFTGELRGGLPNGPGVFRSADGEEHRGDWRDGCLVNERARIAVLTRLSDCPAPPPSRPQRPKQQLPRVDFFR